MTDPTPPRAPGPGLDLADLDEIEDRWTRDDPRLLRHDVRVLIDEVRRLARERDNVRAEPPPHEAIGAPDDDAVLLVAQAAELARVVAALEWTAGYAQQQRDLAQAEQRGRQAFAFQQIHATVLAALGAGA